MRISPDQVPGCRNRLASALCPRVEAPCATDFDNDGGSSAARSSLPGDLNGDAPRTREEQPMSDRLQAELQIDWAGVALALQLLDDLQQLRGENSHLRQRLNRFEEP